MPSKVRGSDDFESDDLDFTIIYPNGGTEASPANVSSDSRYVEANPFPGHTVVCQIEVLHEASGGGDGWGDPGWEGNTGSGDATYGARANQLNQSDIVVQTGKTATAARSSQTGSPHGYESGTFTNVPCRVKVWKVKGATV